MNCRNLIFRLICLEMLMCLPSISPRLQAQVDDVLKQGLLQNWQTDPRQAIQDVKRYAAKAQSQENKVEYAWALNFEGVVLGALGEYDSSYQCYARSLAYCQAHGIQEIEKKTRMNIAINLQYQGKYVESAKQYMQVLQIFEETHDTLGMGHAYSGLGGVSNYLGESGKAIAQYQQAIRLYTAIGAIPLTGPIWSNLGVLYRDRNQADSALVCMELAKQLLTESGNQIALVSLYTNLAGLYETDQPDKAQSYYTQGLELAQAIDFPRGLLQNSAGMARLWLMQRAYPQAAKYAQSTLRHALQLQDQQSEIEALRVLHEAQAAMGQYAQAYPHLLRLKTLNDSLVGYDSKKAVAELEIKYATLKKEKELAQQRIRLAQQEIENQQATTRNVRLTLWLTVLVAALIIALIGGLWIGWVQHSKRQQLRQQMEMNRRIEAERHAKEIGEEKLRISRELHDNIGSQITYIISSLDNLSYGSGGADTLGKVGEIAGYGREALADLRQAIWALHVDARFSDVARRAAAMGNRHFPPEVCTVEEQIDHDAKLNASEAIHLLRILQEALQNAAKYAHATQIRLRFESDARGWAVSVTDNGSGFDPESQPLGEGTGLPGMRTRAAAIHAQFLLHSEPGQGTTITVQKR